MCSAAVQPVLVPLGGAGALSDAALWHQCFFDPPETFDSSSSSASQIATSLVHSDGQRDDLNLL